MPSISASAPGKVILFGEHAVVYGQPAIAVPVTQVKAKAIVTANPRNAPGKVRVQAPDVGLESTLEELDAGHPLAAAIQAAASSLKVKPIPAATGMVEVILTCHEDADYAFILNFSLEPQTITLKHPYVLLSTGQRVGETLTVAPVDIALLKAVNS